MCAMPNRKLSFFLCLLCYKLYLINLAPLNLAVEEIKPQPVRDIPVTGNNENRKTEVIDNRPATNHTMAKSDKPVESFSHVHESAAVSKNTYVREKYQNEGMPLSILLCCS